MTEVYPGYADEVAFYAVGEDPTEDLERLERFRIGQGHPWPVAESDPSIIRSFRVLERSTKIAVDAQGIITYRAGYGRGSDDKWHEAFRGLLESVSP